MKSLLGIVLFVTPISGASAADWIEIGTSDTGSVFEMDTDSVREQKSFPKPVVSAWFQINHADDKTIAHRTTKIMYHFRCDDREMAIKSLINYSASGRVVDSATEPLPSFQPVAPDTIGDLLLTWACVFAGKWE